MGPEPDPTSDVPGMAIWGWMSPAELTWLGARAAEMLSVVEVGSLHGRSAFALLTACPGPVYCIDPWNDAGGHCLASFMASCGHFENLVPLQGWSPGVAFADEVPDTVDMVFVDGAHDYDSVIADVSVWSTKANRLICGHDYIHDGAFPDVAVAVDEWFGRENVRVAEDTAIWYVVV